MADTIRYFATASGRVQGVGFRMFVKEHAAKLGLTGWVCNMEDGTVTMEVQGAKNVVETLLSLIREGNYFIKVSELHLEKREPLAKPQSGFGIRY